MITSIQVYNNQGIMTHMQVDIGPDINILYPKGDWDIPNLSSREAYNIFMVKGCAVASPLN